MSLPTHLIPTVLDIIISSFMFIAPLPTFYKIYTNNSTEGFQSLPYSMKLFNCMLLLYYGNLKTENVIIIVNSIGCAVLTIYILLFIIYATQESLISTVKLVFFFNILSYGLIVGTTILATDEGPQRADVFGWICGFFSVCVFAAPLGFMIHRLVIKPNSDENIPDFSFSFLHTLCAIMWVLYGLLIKDYYIAIPNAVGFIFGVAYMILYMVYKYQKNEDGPAPAVVDMQQETVVDLVVIL